MLGALSTLNVFFEYKGLNFEPEWVTSTSGDASACSMFSRSSEASNRKRDFIANTGYTRHKHISTQRTVAQKKFKNFNMTFERGPHEWSKTRFVLLVDVHGSYIQKKPGKTTHEYTLQGQAFHSQLRPKHIVSNECGY
jgi:hypothetical protein